jgi:hypothetical protein
MWNEYLTLMVMAVLLRTSYELSRPTPVTTSAVEFSPKIEPSPREKEWADKAVRRYAETQEKKWRRWNEAMFEPETR